MEHPCVCLKLFEILTCGISSIGTVSSIPLFQTTYDVSKTQVNTNPLKFLWKYFIPNRPYWRYIGPICNIQDLICEVQWFSCILCMGLIVKFRDLLLIFNSANKINIIQRTLSSFQKVVMWLRERTSSHLFFWSSSLPLSRTGHVSYMIWSQCGPVVEVNIANIIYFLLMEIHK